MLVCSECGEEVVPGRPVRELIGVESKRMQHRHKDGEPLCPVMTSSGYQPAMPKRT